MDNQLPDFIIPASTLDVTIRYLMAQPYQQVNNLIQSLATLKQVEKTDDVKRNDQVLKP